MIITWESWIYIFCKLVTKLANCRVSNSVLQAGCPPVTLTSTASMARNFSTWNRYLSIPSRCQQMLPPSTSMNKCHRTTSVLSNLRNSICWLGRRAITLHASLRKLWQLAQIVMSCFRDAISWLNRSSSESSSSSHFRMSLAQPTRDYAKHGKPSLESGSPL